MKIAHIGLRGLPAQYGGIERAVEEITVRLAARGHEVTVYCMRGRYDERLGSYRGVRLEYLPAVRQKSLEMISYAALSTLQSLRGRYDVTHFHALGPSTMSVAPKLLGRATVATVHGLDWQREKWGRLARGYLRAGEWTAHRVVDRTIAVSQSLQKYFAVQHGAAVDYIPNGTTPVTPVELGDAAARYGLEPRKYVLSVGRLTKEKQVHALIEAFRRLPTDMKLVVVGGSSHTDGYVEQLRALAGDDPRIVLTGPLYDATLPRLMSNAYLFVLPSTLEGLPVVLIEALSYGNAVLVSDIPENMEVIAGSEMPCGSHFPVGDVAGLASELGRLIANPELVEAVRCGGAFHVQRNYNWDRIVDATEAIYRDLTNTRGARRGSKKPLASPHGPFGHDQEATVGSSNRRTPAATKPRAT